MVHLLFCRGRHQAGAKRSIHHVSTVYRPCIDLVSAVYPPCIRRAMYEYPPCTDRVSTLYPPCIRLSALYARMYPPSCMILVESTVYILAPARACFPLPSSLVGLRVCPQDVTSPARSCYAGADAPSAPGGRKTSSMSEPKAAHLPTLFMTKLDDRAWVRRCEFELPNVRLRCTGRSMAHSLERSQSGNLSRSRLASTWTNPEEHGHSRNPSSSKLSSTPSPSSPLAMERRWTPLPPDSPLLRSTGSFGSTGSLASTGSPDLEHGYSGLLNLQPSETPSSVIAPGLSPAMLRASASGSLGRAFGSLPKSGRFNGATRPSPPGRLGPSRFRLLAAPRTPGEPQPRRVPPAGCQRRPPRAFSHPGPRPGRLACGGSSTTAGIPCSLPAPVAPRPPARSRRSRGIGTSNPPGSSRPRRRRGARLPDGQASAGCRATATTTTTCRRATACAVPASRRRSPTACPPSQASSRRKTYGCGSTSRFRRSLGSELWSVYI